MAGVLSVFDPPGLQKRERAGSRAAHMQPPGRRAVGGLYLDHSVHSAELVKRSRGEFRAARPPRALWQWRSHDRRPADGHRS